MYCVSKFISIFEQIFLQEIFLHNNIHYMKSFSQKITTIIAALAISVVALAQPTWNRVDYTATMAFIGEVRINQYDAAFPRMVQENDYIGAFVGNECRMIAKIVSFDSKLYVSSVIHGGDVFLAANSGELLEFKLWNSTTNTAEPTPIRGTLLSLPNDEILTYIIGKPNENAEVLSLEVANRSLSPAFSNAQKTYEIEFEAGAELPALSDVSLILADLRATYNVTLPTNFDDDNKLVVTVTAEDGTTKSIFTITCTQSACATPAPTVENNTLKFCVGDDAPALTATGTNLKWYDGETPLASAPTISTAAASNKAYFVTQTIGCESAKTRIDVVVNALPEVSISANKTEVLNTESLTLTLVPTTGGTLKGSDGVVGLTFDPSKSALGEQTLTYSYIDANSCENSDEVKILVKNGKIEKPTLDNTTVNVLVNDPAPVLEANADGTITWYDKDKHKVGEGESFPTNIDTNGEGTYTYYVSNTVDGVESELVEITINVSNCATPAPTVKNNILKFCVGGDASTLTATGTNLKWYEGGTHLASAPTISTVAVGSKTYFVTQTIGCESAKTRIDVTVNALPVVSISANKTEVLNTESLTLTLVPAAGGTLTGSSGVVGLMFNPALAPLGLQNLIYSYTDNNGCKNSDNTTITVKNGMVEMPIVPKTIYVLVVGDAVPTITAEGANLRWLNQVGTQVGSGNSFTPQISTNVAGNHQFTVVNTKDGVDSQPVPITIIVQSCAADKPTILTQRVNLCEGDKASSLADYAYGSNLKWYDGETLLPAAPTPNTGATGVKTYHVTQTTDCESPRAMITVEVFAKPTVSIFASANEVCTTEKLTIQLLPVGGNFSGPGTMLLSEFTPNPSAIGLQTLTYTYTDANKCSNTVSTTVTIKSCPVGPKPTAITIVDKPVLAISEAYLMQSKLTPADVVAQVHWSVNNPAIASIDRNTGVITGKSSGLVKVTAQLVDDKSISDYIIIRVVPQPVVTGVTVNSAGTEVSISFSEWIETPKNSVLFDIQIYNGTQEYIIYKATINRNNVLVLSLAEPIEDITNVKIKYVGTSISSMLGALVPAFEQPVIATSIAMIDNQVFTLYPTFAHDIVSIETSSEVDNIIVVNSQGQLILAQHATAPLTQISVAHLAQGNYSVVAFSKNQIVGTARFVKK